MRSHLFREYLRHNEFIRKPILAVGQGPRWIRFMKKWQEISWHCHLQCPQLTWLFYSFNCEYCSFVKDKQSNRKGTLITFYNTIKVMSWARSRDLRITRKASWPLAQRGVLILINPLLVIAITLLPQILLLCTARRISYGITATRKCWLPFHQRCINMLQGQTYTVNDSLCCVFTSRRGHQM